MEPSCDKPHASAYGTRRLARNPPAVGPRAPAQRGPNRARGRRSRIGPSIPYRGMQILQGI
eukprot:5886795-Pyramimonas_sp.AAC.1